MLQDHGQQLGLASNHTLNPAAQDALERTSWLLSGGPYRAQLASIWDAFVWLGLLQDPSYLGRFLFVFKIKVAVKPTEGQEIGEANN